jgi:hypothetical protein
LKTSFKSRFCTTCRRLGTADPEIISGDLDRREEEDDETPKGVLETPLDRKLLDLFRAEDMAFHDEVRYNSAMKVTLQLNAVSYFPSFSYSYPVYCVLNDCEL